MLDQLCATTGLAVPSGPLPTDTGETLTFRLIAALVGQAVFCRRRWECRNACLDDLSGSGPKERVLAAFPAAAVALAGAGSHPLGEAAYDFWFVRVDNRPELCCDGQGTVWDRDGNTFELTSLNRTFRRITPIVARIGERLLL